MKFLVAFKKGDTYLVKLKAEDGAERWVQTTDKVYNYAKNQIKENEEVKAELTEKDGQYYTERVEKVTTSTSSTGSQNQPPDKPVKNDDDETPSGTRTSIERQVVIKAVATSLTSLQGQVDPNTVCDVAKALIEVYDAYITK